MLGFLNIDKPPHVTSRWVVDQVKWLVDPIKVGHAGTLDPLATGVLVVGVGAATRLIEYIHQTPKRYVAEFLLGHTSTTDDVDGDVTELADPPQPGPAEIEQAAARFVGNILQRPPPYSAVKVRGRRAYELARQGATVELEPRPVTVHMLKVTQYDYPRLRIDLECSAGTYVRAIGRDLAESLGTGAVMSALRRTQVGGFRVEDAVQVDDLTQESLSQHLLPLARAVGHLPAIVLDDAEQHRVANGQFIERPALTADLPQAHDFAAYDAHGNLVAVLRRRSDGLLGPAVNLPSR